MCRDGWTQAGNECYHISGNTMNWNAAKQVCIFSSVLSSWFYIVGTVLLKGSYDFEKSSMV